ncbi:hypothetical protein [Croceivirga thetidis]|uniref:Nudix hydrolase domain-containing protein n=1 Tax=Croceivirga thetidis TaxID=2721623 RepID=A0ABX1GXH5_9FLAO|nr:hypothetical protein [Croceivirga thetidis]NKI33402.1 hypothetical protein [Croceivirga thetidis]
MLDITTKTTETLLNFGAESKHQVPVFFSIGEDAQSKARQTHSWHLKTTIGTGGFIAESHNLQEEFEIQELIETFLTNKFDQHTSIKKICSIFNEFGEIEYHWYLKDPFINIDFEEIQNVRTISFNLEKDIEWKNTEHLISYLTNSDKARKAQSGKIQEMISYALN